jgi:hypothetical protein
MLLDDFLFGPFLLLVVICPDSDKVVGTTSDETLLRGDLSLSGGTRASVVGCGND